MQKGVQWGPTNPMLHWHLESTQLPSLPQSLAVWQGGTPCGGDASFARPPASIRSDPRSSVLSAAAEGVAFAFGRQQGPLKFPHHALVMHTLAQGVEFVMHGHASVTSVERQS